MKAVELMARLKMSKKGNNIMRGLYLQLYPSYKQVQIAKKDCYPEGVLVTLTQCEVPLKNLLAYTTDRIFKSIPWGTKLPINKS